MKWFRLYDEIQYDTKLRRMPIAHRYAFIMLLCMASRSSVRGVILNLDDEDLSFELEMQTEDWLTLKSKFRVKGLIELVQGGIKIANWDDRQFASDSSADRVAAYREKKKKRDCNVTSELQSRDCNNTRADTDSYPDPNSEQIQSKADSDRSSQTETIALPENSSENITEDKSTTDDLDSVKGKPEINAKTGKPRKGRKSSGGALAANSVANPETFEAWWKSYRQMCLMIDAEPGRKSEAVAEWLEHPEVYESQRFQDGDRAYAEYVGRRFQQKGEVYGVSHGCRYLRSDKWADALDRAALSQQVGVNLSDPQSVKAAAKKSADDRMWEEVRAEAMKMQPKVAEVDYAEF